MKVRHCCKWLENLLADPGEKGFSVVPVRGTTERYFVLQARCVDPRSIEELKKRRLGPDWTPVSIALSMDLLLQYCPSCGFHLSDLIMEQTNAFDEAARAVAHLQAGYGQIF